MLSAYIHRAKSNLRNGKSRTPLLFEDIKTNASITINVGMKDLGPKRNLKRVQEKTSLSLRKKKGAHTTKQNKAFLSNHIHKSKSEIAPLTAKQITFGGLKG